jgi:hypothetical protein
MNYLLRQPILSPSGTLLVRSRWNRTTKVEGHGPRAFTNVTLIILRVVDRAAAHRRGALYSSRPAPCETPTGWGTSSRARGGV